MKDHSLRHPVFLTLVSFLAAAGLASAAVSFDFTSAEGFVGSPSAALDGQQGWTATAGILVNVDPAKEFLFINGGGQNAVYGGSSLNPQDGTWVFVQDFKLNYDQGATEDVYNVFKLDSDLPGEIARVFLKYNATSGFFFLRYSTGNGFDQNIKSSNTFLPSAIGMEGDSTTDDLRLTWKLKRGADAASWTIDVVLENLTTASVVDLNSNAEATNWVATVTVDDGFHSDTSILLGLSAPGSALTNANVYSISASAAPENFWEGANSAGDGLLFLDWLGYFQVFSDTPFGYMYHFQHGWLYYSGSDIDNFWVYDFAFAHWVHFGSNTYPWIYIDGGGEISGWNYFHGGTLDGRRFYNLASDSDWPS